MRYVYLIGRILFALIFVVGSTRHFSHEGIQHAADLGVPLAKLAVPVSGVMALVGGLSVAAGYKAKWGAWLLVGFLVPVTFLMHAFWKAPDLVQAHIQQALFAKNISMLGAALLLTQFGAGPISFDSPKSWARKGEATFS